MEKQCVYLSGVACKNRVLKGDPCLHVFAGIDIYNLNAYNTWRKTRNGAYQKLLEQICCLHHMSCTPDVLGPEVSTKEPTKLEKH